MWAAAFTSRAFSDEAPQKNGEVIAILDAVAMRVRAYGWPDRKDIYPVRKQAANQHDPQGAVYAVLSLMQMGQHNDVRLTWWQSKNSNVRKICLSALLLRSVDVIVLDEQREAFKEAIGRFEETERAHRKKEMDEVLADGDRLREALIATLKSK